MPSYITSISWYLISKSFLSTKSLDSVTFLKKSDFLSLDIRPEFFLTGIKLFLFKIDNFTSLSLSSSFKLKLVTSRESPNADEKEILAGDVTLELELEVCWEQFELMYDSIFSKLPKSIPWKNLWFFRVLYPFSDWSIINSY